MIAKVHLGAKMASTEEAEMETDQGSNNAPSEEVTAKVSSNLFFFFLNRTTHTKQKKKAGINGVAGYSRHVLYLRACTY